MVNQPISNWLEPGKRLEGKIVLITGANSGIGLATAKRFAMEGAYVYITGRRQDALDKAAAIIGKSVTAIHGDCADQADLDHIFSVIAAAHNHIDIVFANAGLGAFEALGKISEEGFDITFNVNVKGTLFTVQKSLPFLTSGASIILTGSFTGIHDTAGLSVYSATKAAICNFARSWALVLKRSGVRVNVLSSGATKKTGMLILLEASGQSDQGMQQFKEQTSLGPIGDPEEIAAAALFLASDESSNITGSEIFVGGRLARV